MLSVISVQNEKKLLTSGYPRAKKRIYCIFHPITTSKSQPPSLASFQLKAVQLVVDFQHQQSVKLQFNLISSVTNSRRKGWRKESIRMRARMCHVEIKFNSRDSKIWSAIGEANVQKKSSRNEWNDGGGEKSSRGEKRQKVERWMLHELPLLSLYVSRPVKTKNLQAETDVGGRWNRVVQGENRR